MQVTSADAANRQRPKGLLLPAAILLTVVGTCVALNALDESARVDIDLPEIAIHEAELGSLSDGYHPLLLRTNQGDIEYRYSPAPGAHLGAVLVTGADGGFASHAKDLYTRLCEELPGEGIACLRVRYRDIRYGWIAVNEVRITTLDYRTIVAYNGQGVLSLRTIPDPEGPLVTNISPGEIMYVNDAIAGGTWLLLEHGTGTGWAQGSAVQVVHEGTGVPSTAYAPVTTVTIPVVPQTTTV